MFYTRAIDYLEALNIYTEEDDDHETRRKQLKMMFEGEDWQTLQSLTDNGTITPKESEDTPASARCHWHDDQAKDHYWHFWDKLLSDIHHLPDEGIHALNTHITTLIPQCNFLHPKTQEIFKLMVLQHAA